MADQVGQVVRDGHVQLVDRTPSEVRARFGQLFEIVHGVQPEKVPVHVWIGQVVSGYIGQGAEPLVNVIVLRVLDDVVANGFLIAEERLVVVVRGQITVDHFRVVPHSDLKCSCDVIGIVRYSTALYRNGQFCNERVSKI